MKILAMFLALSLSSARAESTDAELMDAIAKTQELLRDPKARKEAATTKEAKSADDLLESIAGNPENAQLIYELAAEVFGDLAKDAQSDPDKMAAILEEAKRDPAAFAAKLSPERRAKIKALSKKIPDPT